MRWPSHALTSKRKIDTTPVPAAVRVAEAPSLTFF
jgi:hypothetical protein